MVFAPLDDWAVSGQKAIAGGTQKLEAPLKTCFVNVIEKQASDAARLVAMF
jgi:hypothetical protein